MISFERAAIPVPAAVHFEEHTISLDADVNPAGEFVFVTRGLDGISIHFPSRGTTQYLSWSLRFPQIRWIGRSEALLFDARTGDGQKNAWVIDDTGTTRSRFAIGDAIEDVLATGELIVATYFDEGVFGDDDLSQNGIGVFEVTGRFLWGWNSSSLHDRLAIYDCYAAGLTDDDAALGAFLYSNYTGAPSYAFAMLDIDAGVALLHPVPERLHRTHALSATRDGVWLFASGPRDQQDVVAWRPGDAGYELAPSPVHLTRGLRGGRFLSITGGTVEVVTVTLRRRP